MAEGADDDGEKSEEPTQKKMDDARKRGDVVKSQEVNNLFMLAGAALALAIFGGDAAASLAAFLGNFLGNMHEVATDGLSLTNVALRVVLLIGAVLGLPFLILIVCALAGNLVQTGFLWTADPVTPKLSKVSPIAGFKRLFSVQSLVNFGKGIGKLILVGVAVGFAVWPEREALGLLAELDVTGFMPYALDLSIKVFGTAIAVMIVLAGADFFYQRQSWYRRQRMSFREIREEYKQMEGDPQIKARIRQLRQQRAGKRMMAQVPEASVIITNPTHYAVALKYEAGMNAPLCLAKGMDALALRIRERGREHDVPIVENPPLARALYASVEIDAEVPAEHYRAVAEVIGYVMRLKRGRPSWR
jgi:flagellar biosynthesis protein FlhB